MSDKYRIEIKEVKESIRIVEVNKSDYDSVEALEKNVAEYLDNYSFDDLGEEKSIDSEIFINGKQIDEIEG